MNDDKVKAESTLPKDQTEIASITTTVSSLDDGNNNVDGDGKDGDESVKTKTVNLTTETNDGRMYMTKQ